MLIPGKDQLKDPMTNEASIQMIGMMMGELAMAELFAKAAPPNLGNFGMN